MQIPVRIYVIGLLGIAGAILGLTTANPWLTAEAFVALMLIVIVAWRTDEPPALLFIGSMQWMAAAIALLRADYEGRELWTYSRSAHIDEATALSLAAVTVFVVGVRLGFGRPVLPIEGPATMTSGISNRLLMLWLGSIPAIAALRFLDVGGFSQAIRALVQAKWVIVLLLFMVLIRRRAAWPYVLGVLVAEVGLGFLSFFAGFKTPFFLLAIAFLGAQRQFRLSVALSVAAVAALTICLGVVWTAIKADYRDYISGYSGQQSIEVSTDEQVVEFRSLVEALDGDRMSRAVESLVVRIGYVEFFAAVMDFVPRVVPHEEGRRVLGAFEHVLSPRILFPEKPVLDDTADTERYTGLDLNSGRQTSISIGYPAESYVDGGVTWMFLPVLFFGWLHGRLGRTLLRATRDPVIATAFVTIFLLNADTLENGLAKMLGGDVMMFGVFFAAAKMCAPTLSRFLWRGVSFETRRVAV
jgi:hypothetical protein